MLTAKEENLEKLIKVGFQVCPWEVKTHPFGGSTQLEKEGSPFYFYIGNDYAVGNYCFFQEFEDLRLIEDDILILMLDKWLPFPDISRDSGHVDEGSGNCGVLYEVGFRGTDSGEIYGQLIVAREYIQAALNKIHPSKELSKRNFDIISGRFVRNFNEVLRPIGNIETYSERYATREENRKERLIEQFVQLIHAVKGNERVKFGGITDRIKSLSPLDYDPHVAIQNILSGKYNNARLQ